MAKSLKRRTMLKASLLGAGSTVLLARHGRAQAEKPLYGGKLRVAFQIAPGALDPVVGRSGGDHYYWRPIVDQLVDADPSLNPRPETSLATSWDVSDPKKVVLNLRKGVQFHDGTPFNAEAVKFNIERMLDPATKATPRAAFTAIDKVDVVDEDIVRFSLTRPWGSVLSTLADRGGAMNSPTAVKAMGPDYIFKPVSTGPFKIAEYVSGSHVRYVRNDKYWGRDAAGNPLPYLDEVVMNIVPDPTVQVSALRAGEIDLAYLPLREVSNFETNPNFNMRKYEGGGIAFNVPWLARITRSQALALRELDRVAAAQASGTSTIKNKVGHILPNAVAPVIGQATLGLGYAVLAEAALGFIGVGVTPPTPTWGNMLQAAFPFLEKQPALSVAPGVAIFQLVLAFNLLGDALRDILDPRLRGVVR